MKILVTGGAGFIGSHVAEAFLGAGHKVAVLDDLSMGRKENVPPGAEFVELDIRNPRIGELFRENRFDVVIHHAAQMDVRKSVEDPSNDADVNILGTLNLLQNCVAHGVGRFIFASTGGAIYGEQEAFPATEDHPTRPVSPYGVSKLSVEKYLHYYRVVNGLEYTVLRYANVYGPRQNPHGEAGVVAIFVSKMLEGSKPVINGDGGQTRDYVFVGDVVAANLLAPGVKGSGVFNIGTGIETSVNDIFRGLRALTGSDTPEVHGPAKKGEQTRSVIDSSLARRVMGWTPAVSLADGLGRTVDYFRNAAGR
ncbi:MAG TPA: NAD-dependent epimerase/dehydratase family protein [Bacteroidota bacterium]